MGPNKTLEVLPELTGTAVINSVALPTGLRDDRSGALPTAPFDTISTHGVVKSITRGRRDKLDGLYHLIFKNIRAGNVDFFCYSELTELVNEFDMYTRYVREFNETKLRNEKKRIFDNVMSYSCQDVKRLICQMMSLRDIYSVKLTHIVPLSLDSLLERKELMYRNIARILAGKARNIAWNHRAFKHTFRYTSADDERLEYYFFERTMREINYIELRPIIRTMYESANAIQIGKKSRMRYRMLYEYRSESEYHECEHCGHHECSGNCHLAQRSRMRIAQFRRETGYGDDYDD